MTIRIPVEAEVRGVLKSFQDIREAIRQTGQTGTSFQDLDFSHPELRELEDDIRRVQHQFEELGRVGQGRTAASVRKAIDQNADVMSWLDNVDKVHPDQGSRDRHMATVGKYVLSGTRYDMNLPGGAPSPPPRSSGGDGESGGGEGGGGRGGGGGGGSSSFLGGSLRSAAKFAIGATIGGDLLKSIFQGYEGAKHEDVMNDGLYRRVDDASVSFDQLRESVRGLASSIAATDNEAQGLAETWARLGRHESAAATVADTRYASQFARGYGVSKAGMVSTMAQAQMLGEDPRQFAMILAEAVKQGGQGGQVEETSRALLRWTESAERTLVTHSNLSGFAQFYSALTASGQPGLMGANGEALIGQINSAIQNGGSAGPGGQALMMRALMHYGGIRDPYDMQYQLAGGAFERMGKNGTGPMNIQAVLKELQGEMGGRASGHMMDSAISSLFGIGVRQADGLRTAMTSAKWGTLQSAADANKIDLSKVDPGNFKDMEDAATGSGSQLRDMARALLGRKGDDALGKGDKDTLTAAEGGPDTVLRSAILKIFSANGMTTTTGNTVQQADADLSNVLQRTAGALVEPMSGLKDNVAKLLGPVSAIAAYFSAKLTDNTDLSSTKGSQGLAGYLEDLGAAARGDQGAKDRVQTYLQKWKESNAGGKRVDPTGLSDTPALLNVVRAAVSKAADAHGLGRSDALGLARAEGGGLDLISGAGAEGAMQIMPGMRGGPRHH